MPLCGFNEMMFGGLRLMGISEDVINTLKEMDDQYDQVLRPKYGAEKALRLLAEEFGQDKVSRELLKGFTLFARGLYEQAKKRATKDGISLGESYKREITDMDIFLSELERL
jgi:hypothetical protein